MLTKYIEIVYNRVSLWEKLHKKKERIEALEKGEHIHDGEYEEVSGKSIVR